MDVEQVQQYVVSGLEAVRFKLVRNLEDTDDDDYFTPDMCHQIFGENETIFGYRNLKINVMYDAATFKCYVNHSYESKIETDMEKNLAAEDFMEKLNPWLPSNYFVKRSEFVQCITERKKIAPFGKLIGSFTLNTATKKGREFEIYTCNSKEPGYADFHQRMETLILWFIDAANFIDIEDEKWLFFILYEKESRSSSVSYFPVGYSTVYEYFAYPESRRYRISQFIIFPPYQNVGLGTELLKGVYEHLSSIKNIYDITVEDPSEKFQMMRDYLDARSCLTLSTFNVKHIKGDFSKEMVNDARCKFKINEKQCRRVYEILRLFFTNVDDAADYNAYKMIVKNRLNAPFRKQQQQNKKLSRYFKDAPYIQYDHRLKIIEKDFQHLMKQYRHIIYRLRNH